MSGRLRRMALVVAILMLLSVVSGEAAIAFWRAPGTRSGAGVVTTGILNYWRLGDATTLADKIEPPNKNGTRVNGPVPGWAARCWRVHRSGRWGMACGRKWRPSAPRCERLSVAATRSAQQRRPRKRQRPGHRPGPRFGRHPCRAPCRQANCYLASSFLASSYLVSGYS